MRYFFLLLFMLSLSGPVLASDASDWQAQLQAEVVRLTQRYPDIKANGQVVVDGTNNELRALLPALTVTSPDKSQWLIPAIALQTSASPGATGPVKILLPTHITRVNTAKKEIARLVIGQQTLSGTWNFAGSYFQSLNGDLQKISFTDSIAKAQSTVDNVAISVATPSTVDFIVTNINNNSGAQSQSAIGKINFKYKFAGAENLTLLRVVGLLNPALLLAEKQNFTIEAIADQISNTTGNRTTSIERIASSFIIQPKGKTVAANTNVKVYTVRQSPAAAYNFLLPRQMTMVSNFDNLPLELVSFAPGMSFAMAKETMAKAGTLIDIKDINGQSFGVLTLTGNGKLKANSTVPSGFTGRITLKLNNLQEAVQAMQAQMLNGDSTNRSAATQGMMIAMVLQGLSKQNGKVTEYVIDLTPEGQILINGQNFSGLAGAGVPNTQSPAMPVEKVIGSDL